MTDLEEQIEGFRGLLTRAITKKNSLFQLSSMDEKEDQQKIDAAKKEVQKLKNVLEEAIDEFKEYQLLEKSVEGVRVTKDPTPEQGSESTSTALISLNVVSSVDSKNASPALLKTSLSQLPNDLPLFIPDNEELELEVNAKLSTYKLFLFPTRRPCIQCNVCLGILSYFSLVANVHIC